MGWNNLQIKEKNHPVLKNINKDEQYYFVHSFALYTEEINEIMAYTTYDQKIPAIIGKNNFLGVQFHPEKSGKSGQKFIHNWLSWIPES